MFGFYLVMEFALSAWMALGSASIASELYGSAYSAVTAVMTAVTAIRMIGANLACRQNVQIWIKTHGVALLWVDTALMAAVGLGVAFGELSVLQRFLILATSAAVVGSTERTLWEVWKRNRGDAEIVENRKDSYESAGMLLGSFSAWALQEFLGIKPTAELLLGVQAVLGVIHATSLILTVKRRK